MSLIIKGMDMPKTPKQIIIYPNGTIVDGDKKGTKILKAQAIEIPTPHGRLIDADDLKADFIHSLDYESICEEKSTFKVYYSRNQILNAPTILEAED